MRTKRFLITGIIILSFICQGLQGQTRFRGTIADSASKQVIPFVNVVAKENEKFITGTSTEKDGGFEFTAPASCNKIKISYIGYDTKTIAFDKTKAEISFDTIYLRQNDVLLEEVNIISSVARIRKTPVAISTIKSQKIETELGDQPFPGIMKMVPGAYPTRYGGGSGDARISLRGFQQENIALLLNGIPVGSVENGLVYWNNWLGLAEATEFIQVQKGLGASNIALNSVGGTINIITKTPNPEPQASMLYSITSYGNKKFTLSLSTGEIKKGLYITFLGSRTTGNGYVDGTYVDAYGYFLTISKEFNPKHKIVFTALGSPERHGQRNFKLSQKEIDLHGVKFNKDWGSYNGEMNNLSENFYHKPHFSLNHYWKISKKSMLSTAAYLSFGYGGGKWSESFGTYPRIPQYRNPSGQIDWASVYEANVNNTDTYTLANGETVSGYSQNIQTHFLASHIWYGLMSSYKCRLSPRFNLLGGFHVRHFRSHLYEKVKDLLGGKFWIEDYAWAIDGVAGREQIKTVGDIIKVDNNAIIEYGGLFGQVEYSDGPLTAILSATASNTWFQREDRYNYVTDIKSETINKAGFDTKLGMNYNIDDQNNLFMNAGYYSKAPYFKFVFGNFTNVPSKDLKNEKIKAIELGYGFNSPRVKIGLNTYLTYWEDKNFLSNEYIQLQNDKQSRAVVTGLDALHKAIELDISYKASSFLTAGGIASLGSWKWKNNVQATLYNDNNVAVDTVNVYADGLYVGDAPQTQLGLYANFTIFRNLEFNAQMVYYEKLYADFDPTSRNNPKDHQQPYKVPAYTLIDLHLKYGFDIFGKQTLGTIGCFNALDRKHIVRGEDGNQHDLDTFRGFWSFGRTFAFSLKINI